MSLPSGVSPPSMASPWLLCQKTTAAARLCQAHAWEGAPSLGPHMVLSCAKPWHDVHFCHLLRSQKLKGILQVSNTFFPQRASPGLGRVFPPTRTLAWCPPAGHSTRYTGLSLPAPPPGPGPGLLSRVGLSPRVPEDRPWRPVVSGRLCRWKPETGEKMILLPSPKEDPEIVPRIGNAFYTRMV